jgi:AraC-like DNA-binding protein
MIRQDIFADYPAIPYVSFSDREKATELFYDVVKSGGASALSRRSKLLLLIDMLINDNFPDCFLLTENRCTVAQQLKEYIDAGQGMTAQLHDFEKLFSYSKYYLEREFKQCYGISLMAYRNQVRMEKAKKFLETRSVTEASEALGFSSVYVFSRAFRRYYGVCPTTIKHAEREKL